MSTKDPFGFIHAVKTPPYATKGEGCFAVFVIGGKGRATAVYTKEFLNDVVIPNTLAEYGNVEYFVFPESEFERITRIKSY